MARRALFDTMRSIAFGSISGTYAAIGSALTVEPRILVITNNTDADMIISDDNTVSAGKFILPTKTALTLDLTANMNPENDDTFLMGKGGSVYVKQVSAPSSGSVYLSIVYGVIN